MYFEIKIGAVVKCSTSKVERKKRIVVYCVYVYTISKAQKRYYMSIYLDVDNRTIERDVQRVVVVVVLCNALHTHTHICILDV